MSTRRRGGLVKYALMIKGGVSLLADVRITVSWTSHCIDSSFSSAWLWFVELQGCTRSSGARDPLRKIDHTSMRSTEETRVPRA